MQEKVGFLLGVVGAVAALMAVIFSLNYFGYAQFAFFAPKMEQVRYNAIKEGQAFNEGTIRELYAYKRDYDKADAGGRMALRGAILHEFSTYPRERLPQDLQAFYAQVEGEQ